MTSAASLLRPSIPASANAATNVATVGECRDANRSGECGRLPYGGSVVSSGIDGNANGTLDDGEIRDRTVSCTPASAAVLLRLRPEPKGTNCAVDGTAVDSGPDTNGNGTLDADLQDVGGTLTLTDNAEFTGSISAFALGGLQVAGSPLMEVLTLRTSQTELSGSAFIFGNDALREIDLGSIASIRGILGLSVNPALVTTPSSVTRIGGDLLLQDDAALVDLGFDQLQRAGRISIESMDALESVELPALTQVSQIVVDFTDARHLGLPALLGPTEIDVANNRHLPACEVDEVFARIPGLHEQFNNDTTATCAR